MAARFVWIISFCCDNISVGQVIQFRRDREPLAETPTDSARMSSPLAEMEHAVLCRFPVLRLLEFSDQSQSCPLSLPPFVGLIGTLLETVEKPCCVVLPDCSGVAIATCTLVAVNRLRAEFPDLLRNHASVTFRKGVDNVLVHPAQLVYRYEGFFNPDFFKLGIVDRNDSRSLPVKDIARLEKTTRKRPKGQLTSDLGQRQDSVLGSLLDIKASLNRNVLVNHVLLLGARSRLVEELDEWAIQLATGNGRIRRPMKDEVPFGKVVEGGHLALLDGYVAEGEPLVAIASRSVDLAAHCEQAGRLTKGVLVSDIDQLVRDLRSYDSITENQRTVILATDAERDAVRLLEERGCEIWRFSPEEILMGLPSGASTGPLANLITKVSRVRNLVISEVVCKEDSLDSAAGELKEAAETLASADNGTIRELLYSLFRLLMLCAEYVGQDSEHFSEGATRLVESTKGQLRTARMWLSDETFEQINSALDNMHIAAVKLSESSLTPKGTVLIDALRNGNSNGTQCAVIVARSRLEDVQQWLAKSGVAAQIYSINDIPENEVFERVLVLSWPRSSRFDDLVHRYLTTDLRLVAYDFEGKWLSQYRRRYKRSAVSKMLLKRKLQLLGVSSGVHASVSDAADDSSESGGIVSFDITEERFLSRRKGTRNVELGTSEQEMLVDALYVDFVGPTFAYLTEGHELAVLNQYISGEGTGTKVPMRSVDQLKAGDYVLFRESGDSDIIRFLAEDEVGKEQYQVLRAEATRWRRALNSLGKDPRAVWERLRAVGFSRHLLTVKAWLYDESRICPKSVEDVRKIAEASNDKELLASLAQLEKAKDELMSLHISAGFRLTQLLIKELPGKLGVLKRGETELDLGVGKVWIVRIQDLERSPSAQRRSQVNRLLWDATLS